MKINYNKVERSIVIKDDIKNHYFIMKLLLVLNLLNAILRLYDVKEFRFQEIIWLLLGIISVIVLYYFTVKKSTLNKIPVEKIKQLKDRLS